MKQSFQVAERVLEKVHSGMHVQAALNSALARIPAPDRPLVNELVYGSLRFHVLLEERLGRVLSRPHKLPAPMRRFLELALYSLLYQTSAPDYAILNETVALVKKQFGQKLANVCNASLRAILREKDSFPDSRSLSLPPDLFDLWKNAYGEENALALGRRSLGRPFTCYRLNRARANSQGIMQELLSLPAAVQIADDAVAFPPGMAPDLISSQPLKKLHEDGAMTLQAAGSLKVMRELGIYRDWQNAPIWDACAGSGGKTTALLEAGLNVKIASDISQKRLAHLKNECGRLGVACPAILACNAALPPIGIWNGNILADVPCSGTGVLGRRPDIKLRWSLDRTRQLALLQRQILKSFAVLLLPGRELCYITCALNPAENEQQIDFLLRENPDLKLVSSWLTPFDHPWLEGMFGARIARV